MPTLARCATSTDTLLHVQCNTSGHVPVQGKHSPRKHAHSCTMCYFNRHITSRTMQHQWTCACSRQTQPKETCPLLHDVLLQQTHYFTYNATPVDMCLFKANTAQGNMPTLARCATSTDTLLHVQCNTSG